MLNFKNILFVGDPHFSIKKPRRRLDAYVDTLFNKFEQIIELSNLHQAPILVTGDFFHNDNENNLYFLNRLTLLLKKAKYPIYSLKGNHDLKEHTLTHDTTFSLFVNMGLIQEIEDFNPLIFELGDCNLAIIGVSYGQEIPHQITTCADYHVMMTHHNLEFENPYPNSEPLFEIEGCEYVINGHMHHSKADVVKGCTTWKNPGNIIRQSIDCLDHTPQILMFNGENEEFEIIQLKFEDNVFDLRDYQVMASSVKDGVSDLVNREYEFVSVLDEHITNMQQKRLEKTDDKEFINEALDKMNETKPMKKGVRDILNLIFKE